MPPKTKALDHKQSLAFLSRDTGTQDSAAIPRLNAILTTYAICEFLAILVSAFLAGEFYHLAVLQSPQVTRDYLVAATVIAILISLVSLGFQNLVGIRRQPLHVFLWNGVGAIGLAFSIFLTVLFLTKLSDIYSRGTLVFQVLSVTLALTVMRAFFHSWLRSAIASNRVEARRVALVGDADHCLRFSDRLKSSGIQTVGSFRLPSRSIKNVNVGASKIRSMIEVCRRLRADDIVILAGNEDMSRTFDLASSLSELPAGIHFVPVDALDILASSRVTEFGNFLTIQVHRAPLSHFDRAIKRAFDAVSALLGLVVLSPLFLVVSVAIKMDSPGPVFFRQTRHGFNNDEIRVLKFRSMTSTEDGHKFTQATKNDPRVTRIGRILRRTNIDELPQLINVLRGEMSIVGPRPHALAHNALFGNVIGPFSRRHIVKPGITGWAQVNGFRGATDTVEKMQQRIEYDLHYIDNWSFLLDMKIILMTLLSKKAYTNAY